MRPTTLAEVMSSPTSRKNGTARSASESMPLKSCAIIEGKLIGVSAVAMRTPAIRLNATGTPRYPKARNRKPISRRIAPLLMADPLFVGQDVLWLGLRRFEAVAPAVPELLDREQHDECPRDRDHGVIGRERRHRGHAEVPEALQKATASTTQRLKVSTRTRAVPCIVSVMAER